MKNSWISFIQSFLTGKSSNVFSNILFKLIFKSFAIIVLIMPNAARLTPNGSEEPVGFLPSTNTAETVSNLSAIPTTCPSIPFANSLSAFRGK